MEILVEGQLDYFEEKSWKKRYFVMKYEISSALRYIEIYKDKNWQKQLPRHVVNLHPGYNVKQKEDPKKKHCFSVQTTDHVLLLASEDENVITKWMETLEEYNLVKSFCVQPQDTPTMVRIEAIFPCHLQLVHSEVRLVSAMDGKLLGLWPFKCIRRYKFVGNLFSIEAGRKAPTGEGVFEFISNECSEIYRVMDTIIRTKAGNTNMRRLASEKLHNQVEHGYHLPVRKTNSVPVNPSPQKDVHYDYASPTTDTTISRPPPPPVPLPSPPEFPPSETDPTYDILSPGSTGSGEVDGKVFKAGGTATNDYNTLQFANTQAAETKTVSQKTPVMAGSPGSYDTLRFSITSHENMSSDHELPKAKGKDGDYDTLQFGAKMDDPSSVENVPFTENLHEIPHSSGSFYDTLDHSSLPHSSGSVASSIDIPRNTYDSLDVGNRPPSGGPDTYDTLDNTKREVKPPTTLDLASTYDALQQEGQKQTGKKSPVQGVLPQKPTAPIRPPPRMKAPPIPKNPEAPVRKISAGSKPEKPVRPVRKNAPSPKEEDKKAKHESIGDVIQQRLAMPSPVDDGSYASIDHEYTSIDYSKVARSENTSSSDIYAEPDETDVRGNITPKPLTRPPKAKKNHPKPVKNMFKRVPPGPKPRIDADGGNFANELKKKLEIKLKKTGRHKTPGVGQNDQAAGDDIYDEVDNSSSTYSEPFEPNEANI